MRKYLIILYCFLPIVNFAQIKNADAYTGNKLYANGKYKEASAAYEKALHDNKNKETQYNLGNSLYQQKEYEKANKQFEEVVRNVKDKSLKAASNHNIGNTFLEQKKWDEAIQYFKQSLKEHPTSQDTKYNLAYAQAMKKNQDKQDKNKDKKDQDKKDKNNKPEDKKDDQQPQKPEDKKENGDKEKEEQKPQPQPSKLTKDQADQLLNALNQEEKKLKEKKDKANGQPVKLDKDW